MLFLMFFLNLACQANDSVICTEWEYKTKIEYLRPLNEYEKGWNYFVRLNSNKYEICPKERNIGNFCDGFYEAEQKQIQTGVQPNTKIPPSKVTHTKTRCLKWEIID